MRWLNNMNETIKRGIRTWLNVVPASGNCIQINEVLDFEANAIRNRIWSVSYTHLTLPTTSRV